MTEKNKDPGSKSVTGIVHKEPRPTNERTGQEPTPDAGERIRKENRMLLNTKAYNVKSGPVNVARDKMIKRSKKMKLPTND